MNVIRNNKGFTLIEIGIVAAIAALITWLGSFFGCNVHKKDIVQQSQKQEITAEIKDSKSKDKNNKKNSPIDEEKYQIEIDKCEFFLNKQELDNALNSCEEAKKIKDDFKVHYLKGQILYYMGDNDSARREFSEALTKANSSTEKNESKNNFNKVEKFFLEEYLKKDYSKRKLLMPIKNIEDVYTSKTATLFPIKNMPKISFPLGHPIENELYVAHPYTSNKYVTFDNYEIDFLNERVHEFCELAQALGATEVTIETISTKERNYDLTKNTSGEFKSNLGVKDIKIEAGPESKHDEKTSDVESILHGISIYQTFSKPKKEITLPKNLTWFDHEPSWQQLYRQRMMGNLVEHREKIESRASRVIQESELRNFKAELRAGTIFSVTPGWEKNIDQKLQQKEDFVITIHVKFNSPEQEKTLPEEKISGEVEIKNNPI